MLEKKTKRRKNVINICSPNIQINSKSNVEKGINNLHVIANKT